MVELWAIKELRDALVHYDYEDRLTDPTWVHDHMLRAHALARRIAAVEPATVGGSVYDERDAPRGVC